MDQRVAWVTGASSGIGEALAKALTKAGWAVILSGRRVEALQAVAEAAGGETLVLPFEVTDFDALPGIAGQALAWKGRIDLMINNAGVSQRSLALDTDFATYQRIMDIDYFAPLRLTQLVLPHMRAQGHGTVVNISSMGGKIYTPLGGWYHGTKFAVEALSDCLRLEVKPFGIDVVVIEPGGIKTEWGEIAADGLLAASGSGAYADQANAMAETLGAEAGSSRLSPPTVIANAIAKAVTARRPRTRYAVGFGAKPLIAAKTVLPDRTYDTLISRAVGLPTGRPRTAG